eukprot:6459644-Amphidinium_carterae.1
MDESDSDAQSLEEPILEHSQAKQLAGKWGIHRIGVKKPSKQAPHGGFEAVCCMHAKSSKTGCKKLFLLSDAAETTRERAVLSAKYWLGQAGLAQRQWEHVFATVLEPLPASEVIESMRLESLPSDWVMIDDETFMADEGDVAQPTRTRKRKAQACTKYESATGTSHTIPQAFRCKH